MVVIISRGHFNFSKADLGILLEFYSMHIYLDVSPTIVLKTVYDYSNVCTILLEFRRELFLDLRHFGNPAL